ncbi:uncharacterized protein RJT20DRAFT_55481 [Scheffersomyces xylosifermentans]|uniref:uncharacterized protein n=1 Tax=Scheffersomyces xylosifermentans TaxID=1304137 RepID=UPI00315C6540
MNTKLKLLVTAIGIGAISGVVYARCGVSNKASAFQGLFRWTVFKLQKVEQLTPDSKKYTFAFPDSATVSGLKPGSVVLACIKTPKGSAYRPYSPISEDNEKRTFELAIKTYPNGKASQSFNALSVGDTVSFMGPKQEYDYKPNETERIALIGGGCGITPLYQLLHFIAKDPNDKTKVDLFYGSQKDDGIMLKNEIDALVKSRPDQFKVHYFVSEPSEKWEGLKGKISKEYLAENLTTQNTKVYVCGPPGLYKHLCGSSSPIQLRLGGILKELGFNSKDVIKH